jgi:hypothetical protein
MTGIAFALYLLALATLGFGVVNFVRLLLAKGSGTETVGSYHEPVSTTLTVASGVVGIVLALLFLVGLARVDDDRTSGRVLAGGLTLAILTAVAGLWLPSVHTNEIDVAPTGFRQAYYTIPRTDDVTLYNATSLPMTLCVGTRSRCQPNAFAPGEFNDGLHLAPGQAVDVKVNTSDREENDVPMATADWVAYTVTVATPAGGMTQIDTTIHALKGCNDYRDANDC